MDTRLRFHHAAPRACVCLIILLIFAAHLPAQRSNFPGHENSPELQKAISDAAHKYKIPGIAAAWIEHGQIKAIETYGTRDQKSGAPLTSNTVFDAGSLGEPVYAYSLLLLSAEGHFNLGSPIPFYFPPPYVRQLDASASTSQTESLYDPRFNQITAGRVMNHTSGMPDWTPGQHLQLRNEPGKKWSYSSEGYLYLQKAVEQSTGESLENLVTRSILAPARMTRSSFSWSVAYANDFATGYDATGAAVEPKRFARPVATLAFYTSLREYAQFITYLMATSPAQRAHESAVSLMLAPSISVDDSVPFFWGLGLALEKDRGDLYFFHRARPRGSRCFVIASRASGNGIVIFTNSDNGLDSVADILAATGLAGHAVIKSDFLRSR